MALYSKDTSLLVRGISFFLRSRPEPLATIVCLRNVLDAKAFMKDSDILSLYGHVFHIYPPFVRSVRPTIKDPRRLIKSLSAIYVHSLRGLVGDPQR